jgi:two-component system, OmpR family, sensor kinase
MTLRWRLTLFYSLFMVALLSLIVAGFYGVSSNYLFSSLERDLRNDGEAVKRVMANFLRPDLVTIADQIDKSISVSSKAVLVTLADGVPILENAPFVISSNLASLENLGNPIAPKLNLESLIATSDQSREIGIMLGTGNVFVREDSKNDNSNGQKIKLPARILVLYLPKVQSFYSKQPGMLIYLARDTSFIEELLLNLRTTLIFISFIGIGLAAMGSYGLAWRALAPLREVEHAATQITTGQELNRRVPEPGTFDEVQQLAHGINEMLERLEGSFESQRRFTADASHELRTPITAILGHVSYLLRRTQLDEQQRDSLSRIAKESERLRKLVADLLDLARADVGFQLELGDIKPLGIAEDVHLEIAPIAGDAEIVISGDRQLSLRADPNRIKQVLINLVQNAIKAGASQVSIEVTRGESGKEAVIAVADNGPGIAAEHLPRLFDRFYRIDTARNRAQGGSGLGLSIVKWIIDAHKGQIQVESQVGVGTRFVVVLPLA